MPGDATTARARAISSASYAAKSFSRNRSSALYVRTMSGASCAASPPRSSGGTDADASH